LIVIFAGAGASKAVNPRGYPVTEEFFNTLPQGITQQPLFKKLVACFSDIHSKSSQPTDIETVLWALSELRLFMENARNPKSVPGWFLAGNHLKELGAGSVQLVPLHRHAPQYISVIDRLVSSINALVYDLYSPVPKLPQVRGNWHALLKELLVTSDSVQVFTTNYDRIIEAVASYLQRDTNTPVLDTGRRADVDSYIDESLWEPDAKDGNGAHLLTKLHGSVDWARGPDRLYVSDPQYKGDHAKHVILYPGFKGTPTERPFTIFHQHFERCLARAATIVFIGFSFRDQYINEIIRRNVRPNAKVVLVNPNLSLKDTPFASRKVHHFESKFDTASVPRLLATIATPTKQV
jgi:SIR2-like domain